MGGSTPRCVGASSPGPSHPIWHAATTLHRRSGLTARDSSGCRAHKRVSRDWRSERKRGAGMDTLDTMRAVLLLVATLLAGVMAGLFLLYAHTLMPGVRKDSSAAGSKKLFCST